MITCLSRDDCEMTEDGEPCPPLAHSEHPNYVGSGRRSSKRAANFGHLLAGCPPCGGAVVLLWLLVSEKKGQLEGFCEADELGLGGG